MSRPLTYGRIILANGYEADKESYVRGCSMGCCLGVLLLGGAPRIALVLWWFMEPARVDATFRGWSTTIGTMTAPQWIWPLAGLLLVPWTTVAYIFVSPGGLSTLEWVIIVIALLMDLGAHGGGGRAYRQRRTPS